MLIYKEINWPNNPDLVVVFYFFAKKLKHNYFVPDLIDIWRIGIDSVSRMQFKAKTVSVLELLSMCLLLPMCCFVLSFVHSCFSFGKEFFVIVAHSSR